MVNRYTGVVFRGDIAEIVGSREIRREDGVGLVSPPVTTETRIRLVMKNGGEYCGIVFGDVSESCVGKPAEVQFSYDRKCGGKHFRTLLAVENKVVVDQTVVKAYGF